VTRSPSGERDALIVLIAIKIFYCGARNWNGCARLTTAFERIDLATRARASGYVPMTLLRNSPTARRISRASRPSFACSSVIGTSEAYGIQLTGRGHPISTAVVYDRGREALDYQASVKLPSKPVVRGPVRLGAMPSESLACAVSAFRHASPTLRVLPISRLRRFSHRLRSGIVRRSVLVFLNP